MTIIVGGRSLMKSTSKAPYPDAGTAMVRRLRRTLDGRVTAPDDTGYDEARAVYYRGFDRRPAAIVRVTDAADVAEVIGAARAMGAELAVRSGGHSLAGHGASERGIVVDLSAMRGLDIDPVGRTAWAGAGLTAGAYTAAASEHGLATGFGDAPSVGIGGITLGGGVGFLHRKVGLTIDSLLAAEVVTADGRILRTDWQTHPDLFWAIRGGGGNFGIVTRFKYRLHEIDGVMGGMMMLPASRDVLVRFLAELEAAPDELSGLVNVMVAPPMPMIPAEHHGQMILMAILVYAGDREAGERAFAPLRALATPIADMIAPMRYAQVYDHGEGPPAPAFVTVRSLFMDDFGPGDADLLFDQLRASTAPMRAAQFRVLGAAVARVPNDATAFAHRHRRMMATVAAMHDEAEAAAEHAAWTSSLAAALTGPHEPGAYVGFLGDEGEARVRDAYPGATWERLARIKARYDPDNLFRLNQNVPPLAGTSPEGVEQRGPALR
jgi:FAD/FMN-containing dehydrogenase